MMKKIETCLRIQDILEDVGDPVEDGLPGGEAGPGLGIERVAHTREFGIVVSCQLA